MRNSELFLQCIELVARPIKGRDYNYDKLLELAREMITDDGTTDLDKVQKLMSILDKSNNSMHKGSLEPLSVPTEKMLPFETVLERAEELYQLILKKDAIAKVDVSGYIKWLDEVSNKSMLSQWRHSIKVADFFGRDAVPEIKIGDKYAEAEWVVNPSKIEDIPDVHTVVKVGRTKILLDTGKPTNSYGASGLVD